jgi:hypothetical protein
MLECFSKFLWGLSMAVLGIINLWVDPHDLVNSLGLVRRSFFQHGLILRMVGDVNFFLAGISYAHQTIIYTWYIGSGVKA